MTEVEIQKFKSIGYSVVGVTEAALRAFSMSQQEYFAKALMSEGLNYGNCMNFVGQDNTHPTWYCIYKRVSAEHE